MMTVLHSNSKEDAEQSSVYILYKHILSKFNAYNMNTQTLPPPLLTHTPAAYIMAVGLKKKFLKRESFSRKI